MLLPERYTVYTAKPTLLLILIFVRCALYLHSCSALCFGCDRMSYVCNLKSSQSLMIPPPPKWWSLRHDNSFSIVRVWTVDCCILQFFRVWQICICYFGLLWIHSFFFLSAFCCCCFAFITVIFDDDWIVNNYGFRRPSKLIIHCSTHSSINWMGENYECNVCISGIRRWHYIFEPPKIQNQCQKKNESCAQLYQLFNYRLYYNCLVARLRLEARGKGSSFTFFEKNITI